MPFLTPHFQTVRDALVKRPWHFALLFLGVLLPFLAFGKIAEEVHENDTLNFDNAVLHFIHQHATPHRDSIVSWLTVNGGVIAIPAFFAAVAAFYFLKRRANAWFFGAAIVGAYALNLIAKLFFQRVRPALWEGPIRETNYSFPSGHAMVSMAIAMAFICIAWRTKWRWPVVVLGIGSTLAIGFSRLYLGVHYPTDVLGGWLASLIWVCGLYLIFNRESKTPIVI